MVIELLRFKVPPEMLEKYIQLDTEIWTKALAQYPGFLGKEVWTNPHNPQFVILVIHWAKKEDWKAVPQNELDEIGRRFDQALGFSYEMVESSEYQVRGSNTVSDCID
ncbi:MAG: TIGR03792 family protein [Calothrix sp. SM1_7_51]|nr:TIGR03792 family protein [Calothrix sp. SM1_7_51]